MGTILMIITYHSDQSYRISILFVCALYLIFEYRKTVYGISHDFIHLKIKLKKSDLE